MNTPPIQEITLRDYFAAAAMTGLGANSKHVNMTDKEIAKWAYNQADAMIEERNRDTA